MRGCSWLHEFSRRSVNSMAERFEGIDAPDNELTEPRSFSKREVVYALGGVLVGLLILATVWWRVERNTTVLPPLCEVRSYPAPGFTLKDLNGGTVHLSDYTGKVVLLNFWATWSVPCRDETPDLQAVYKQLTAKGW